MSVSPTSIYIQMDIEFGKVLERIGQGSREEDNERRRKYTPHSFRRNYKSTISNLGFGDFSELMLGHASVSTYYRVGQKEQTEIWRKVSPYLTFLDFGALERKGADVSTKVEELEAINNMLRKRDAMNTDAISALSDKLAHVVKEIEVLKQTSKFV